MSPSAGPILFILPLTVLSGYLFHCLLFYISSVISFFLVYFMFLYFLYFCRRYDLQVRQFYSTITDAALDVLVESLTRENPTGIGYRACKILLRNRGIVVPFERVRQSMHRVNPVAAAVRWGRTVPRRHYHSSAPNAVWHIDGNHKLNR